MAATSLLTLIDDIASILDDVSAMTKVAAKKTVGVLGDDLALNAQQVTGVNADHELPVVWAVAKGSVKNKMILIPFALAISALLPWLVTPLLMLGGSFLCYEGFEKLVHKFLPSEDRNKKIRKTPKASNNTESEEDKVKGAVRTDFILSAEIIVISLGTVASKSFLIQLAVLAEIAVLLTIGVYGFVAIIVKLDDGGLYLSLKQGNNFFSKTQNIIGTFILKIAPLLMKGLSFAGTAAMFIVGGGMLAHGIGEDHLLIILEALIGLISGGIILIVIIKLKQIIKSLKTTSTMK